jgi:hypothetical protein
MDQHTRRQVIFILATARTWNLTYFTPLSDNSDWFVISSIIIISKLYFIRKKQREFLLNRRYRGKGINIYFLPLFLLINHSYIHYLRKTESRVPKRKRNKEMNKYTEKGGWEEGERGSAVKIISRRSFLFDCALELFNYKTVQVFWYAIRNTLRPKLV